MATFPRLTSLILFRSLTALSYEDAKHIVRFCANLKRLVLDCDFYGRAIRLLINSLQHTMEVT